MGHVQTTIRKLITWAQVHDLAFSTTSRTDMSYSHSQSVNSNIRHSNEGYLTAVKLEYTLTIITWLYRGLIFYPLRSRSF